MKARTFRPSPPLTRQTLRHSFDRAISHLVRADHQFSIDGPRRKIHWEEALEHLREARGSLEEAVGVLEAMLLVVYPPPDGGTD